MGRLALPPTQRSQRFETLEDRIDYTPGKSVKVKFTKDDYLTEFYLVSDMQVVSGVTPPVVSAWGPWGPLGTVSVRGSNSKRELINLPALYLANYNMLRDRAHVNKQANDTVTASTTTAWNNSLRIPLTIDDQSDKGAVYLGDQGLTFQVELEMPPLTEVFSTVNGATISGGWEVWRVNYNAPPPEDTADKRAAAWVDNISYFRQLRIYDTVTLKNGETRISLPTSEDYARIMLQFYDGANDDQTFAPGANLFEQIRLTVNDKVDLVPNWTPNLVHHKLDNDYAGTFTPGLVPIDYLREWNSRRDVLPTDPSLARTLDLRIEAGGAHNVDVILETSVDSPWAAKYLQARAGKKMAA